VIVRLTHAQIASARGRLPEAHSRAMQDNRSRATRTQSDIDLPAICWFQIAHILKERAFGPLGGRRAEVAPSLYIALRRIQDALNILEAHPALRGHGVIGFDGTLIPAWRLTLSTYTPYPGDGEFVILTPRHFEERGRRFTRWFSGRAVEGEELLHLRWCVEVGA
jgi:hypothetical protein